MRRDAPRSRYETRAIEDGADSLILRRTAARRTPHPSRGRGYERFSWATICREVTKLNVSLTAEFKRMVITA